MLCSLTFPAETPWKLLPGFQTQNTPQSDRVPHPEHPSQPSHRPLPDQAQNEIDQHLVAEPGHSKAETADLLAAFVTHLAILSHCAPAKRAAAAEVV